MATFTDTTGWTLVNNFTIEREEKLTSGRRFLLTRVPERLDATLHNVRAMASVEWASDGTGKLLLDDIGNIKPSEPEGRRRGHKVANRITATATLEDKISVFSIPDGRLHSFDRLAHVRLSGLTGSAERRIGGEHAASTYDALEFSGWSSKKVPEKGLMEGEPGSLYFHYGSDLENGDAKGPQLNLELHMGHEAFQQLSDLITRKTSDIEAVHLSFIAELFQDEVHAALSEPWQRQEYGLLSEKKAEWATARARVESVHIVFEPVSPAERREEGDDQATCAQSSRDASAANPYENVLKSIRRRVGWLIGVLVLFMVSVWLLAS